MALTLTALPRDVLVLIFLRLLVEDVLAVMQVIRAVFVTLFPDTRRHVVSCMHSRHRITCGTRCSPIGISLWISP